MTDVVLITVIASALINPLLNYLVHSRCSKIKCCCIECEREVIDLEDNKKFNKEKK